MVHQSEENTVRPLSRMRAVMKPLRRCAGRLQTPLSGTDSQLLQHCGADQLHTFEGQSKRHSRSSQFMTFPGSVQLAMRSTSRPLHKRT